MNPSTRAGDSITTWPAFIINGRSSNSCNSISIIIIIIIIVIIIALIAIIIVITIITITVYFSFDVSMPCTIK